MVLYASLAADGAGGRSRLTAQQIPALAISPNSIAGAALRSYCTEIITTGDCTPPTDACRETSPDPRPAGIVTLS